MCTGGYRSVIYVKVYTQGCGLVEDVTDLRFDLRVYAARRKRNWSRLCCAHSTPEATKKQSPTSLQTINAYKLTVKAARNAGNSRHVRNRARGTVILFSSSFMQRLIYVRRKWGLQVPMQQRVRPTPPGSLTGDADIQYDFDRPCNVRKVSLQRDCLTWNGGKKGSRASRGILACISGGWRGCSYRIGRRHCNASQNLICRGT